ncbi:sigma-54-dependent Fis family transcriptional regulator, partial [Lactonifactor longoviformis]|nr:sigma-54-dependent Fis family transcriptional regulator [Lactonifactor longoviformis]
VLLLADFFLEKYARKYGKKVTISPEVKQYFLTFPWNGNVRQLQSCMEYAVIVCNEGIIQLEHLPDDLLQHD